jgi:hypothetical protein
MPTPQTMLDKKGVHEHPMVTELLAALQAMDNEARIEARCYEGIEGVAS